MNLWADCAQGGRQYNFPQMNYANSFTATPRQIVASAALLAATFVALIIPSQSQAAFAVQVSAGDLHSCALLQSGHVKCWGEARYGQLGVDGLEASLSAVEVRGISNATQITSSIKSTCAIVDDGEIVCWGFSGQGELGDGTTNNSSLPVKVTGINDAVQIDGGGFHFCALRSSGKISCWGSNAEGQFGDGTKTDSSVPVDGPTIEGVTQISAGSYDTCALADGAVKCWGDNAYGKLGDGTETSSLTPVDAIGVTDAVQVFAATHFTCAVMSDGTAKCWGANHDGQLGVGVWVFSSATPTDVAGVNNALQATGGLWHGCIRLADGTAKCAGINVAGQLGIGEFSCYQCGTSNTPLSVKDLAGVTDIASGNDHTCATTTDGDVKCWGENWPGRLGNGINNDASPKVGSVQGLVSAPSISGVQASVSARWTLFPRLTADENDAITCSVDDGPEFDCSKTTKIGPFQPGTHSMKAFATDSHGRKSPQSSASWRVIRPLVVTGKVPSLMKKNHRWYIDLSSAVQTPQWDCRGPESWPSCRIEQSATVQISTSTTRPSDSEPAPTKPTYANGVVAWTWWGTVGRSSRLRPSWVRVGNIAGNWTKWIAVSKLSKREPQDTEPQDG